MKKKLLFMAAVILLTVNVFVFAESRDAAYIPCWSDDHCPIEYHFYCIRGVCMKAGSTCYWNTKHVENSGYEVIRCLGSDSYSSVGYCATFKDFEAIPGSSTGTCSHM